MLTSRDTSAFRGACVFNGILVYDSSNALVLRVFSSTLGRFDEL